MWKGLFLLVFVVIIDAVISSDDELAVTNAAPITEPTYKPRCGCGGYPPKCGKNEVYNNCSRPVCRPYLCSDLGSPCNTKCTPGCICKDDYLRDENGICIPIKSCPKPPPKCGKNEVYNNCSLPVCRPYNCSNLGFECNFNCTIGCICKTGYLRDDNGDCIPIKCCPRCGGDLNAVSGYGNNCGKTCATYKLKPPPVCKLASRFNDCVCRDGYVYDPNVKACVRPKDCTPTCKGNEVYSPCINCGCRPKNCSQLGQTNICVDPKICIKGCLCVKGYLRDENGKCVPKDQCPKYPPKCGKNEVYYNCSHPGCGPYLCSQLGFPLKCDKKCKPRCICKDGYLRDDNGDCIPIKKCRSCGGDPNAESGCGNNCGKTCATYKLKPPPVCKFACILNGCKCRDGYVYDPNVKACVRPKDCTPTCKVNEEYSPCSNGGCGPKNCSQLGQPNICIDPKICIKGCVCVKGYLRAANGKCVPKDQCPKYPPKCGKNEVYKNCSDPDCGPYLCLELGFPSKCYKNCKPRCICKDGYLRDDNGDCIPIKKCRSCGGDPNAESGCGNNCGNTCATYKLKPRPFCKLICKHNECRCRDGYVYDPNVKACVRPKDCTPTCKDNEEYSPCINGGCGPKNCSQLGQPNICIDPKICIKGCVCVKGYLRAANGTCVPKDKCPPPDCPTGERFEPCPTVPCEGDYCLKTRDSPQTCPVGIVCDSPRCVCGYNRKRDPKTGKCILITDCPPFKCGHNEEYQACPSNCPGEKCSDYMNKPKCPIYKIGIIVNCRPACKCIKGTYRNADGKCVPPCECPTDYPVEKP